MNERCRDLLYIIFLAVMVVLPLTSSHCFASSGNTSFKELVAEEAAGRAAATRKKMMLDYATYVNPGSEVSLREYREGDDAASRAVGRGKAALVLHLLRRVTGEEGFSRIAGKISEASPPALQSWDDLRTIFEKETGKDLGWFFLQWVDRKGLPDLRMENVSVRRSGRKFEVSFDLLQKGEVYTLDMPVSISFVRGGEKADTVRLDAGKKRFFLFFDEEPAAVEIDREYDIPRIPTAAETPPLLAKILSEEKPVLVPPEHGVDIYAGVISAWKKRGAEERLASAVKDSDIRTSAFIVLGENNPFTARLYGRAGASEGELRLAARKNPWNTDKVVVIVEAKSLHAADETMRVLQESGDYSALTVFDRGRVSKETEESERGIRMDLREEPAALDVSAVKTLSHVIEGAAGKKIVYVGEHHDRFAHHQVQVEVIKGLYRKDPKISIGMEMFQRPFQPVLDDYINGAIEEREFLKKTEYFQRWGLDYNLYKPILDFARAERIPVVALNLRREIVEKVSKSGMDTLSGDERKEIPEEMDFSDADYRQRLQQVFARHEGGGERKFDYFYQAQLLWDETMAMSIDEYLKKNPGRRMVVIAGEGHLAYGSGIPKRAFRRNGYEYAVVLNDANVEKDIADYLVYPQTLEGVTAPRLMAVLKESDGAVVIADLPKDSISGKAGLKTGDTIVSIDGARVRTAADVKLELFFNKGDDEIWVKVLRRRFLLGEKHMEFVVKLR